MLGGGVALFVDAAEVGEGADGVEEDGVSVVPFVGKGFDLGAEVVALFGVVVVPAVVGFLADLFGEVFFLQVIDVGVDFFQFVFSFGEFCAAGGGAAVAGVRMRFFLSDRARVKRRAVQDLEIPAVHGKVPVVAGSGEARFVMAFAPFVVPPGKRLIVEVVGQDGRQLRLQVKAGEVGRIRVDQ